MIRFVFREAVRDLRLTFERLAEVSAGEFTAFERLVLVGSSSERVFAWETVAEQLGDADGRHL